MIPIALLDLFVATSLQVILIVLTAMMLSKLLWRAAIVNCIWSICFVCLLANLAIALVFPHYRFGGLWSTLAGDATAAVIRWQWYLGMIVVTTWLIGVLASVTLYLYRTLRLVLLLRSPGEMVSPNELMVKLGIPSTEFPDRVRIVVSDSFAGPFCMQIHRPTIVLPRHLLALDREKLRYIVRHELAHLQTEHPLQLFVQQLAQVVFWFHPFVWWGARQAAMNREFLCDELAVGPREQILQYLRTILQIAESGPVHPFVLPFAHRRHILSHRAHYLLRSAEHPARASFRRLRLFPAAVLVATTLVTTQLWFPVSVLASQEAGWSPWPSWTAQVLHDFGIHARDFEEFDATRQIYRAFHDSSDRRLDPKPKKRLS